MKVLVACEYSGRVRDAFRAKGHNAMSCDLLDSDSPGLHHKGDLFDLDLESFDLIIAHPPCTFLTGAAEWAFDDLPMIQGKPRNIKEGTLIGAARRQAREDALAFVDKIWSLNVPKMCIENPVGVITKRLPHMGKPQYIQQYWFGEDASKKTGLWLRGLPELVPTNYIEGRTVYVEGKKPVLRWGNQTDSGQNKLPPSADRWKIRSTTPQGIANAMAEQWG
tara:strand:- start:16685 stop:17347 length:663 start_codon:yes stop_codon:yes gene_type:complete